MATNKRLIKSNDDAAPIVPTSFNTVLYTGNSGTPQTVTGMGFEPDMVWQKQRTGAAAHRIVDSIRGSGNYLYPNLTNANDGYNADYMRLASDGVYLPGADSNYATNDYVVWGWKAGGAAVTNTDGTITSQVSANVEAGFSIVSFTSPSSANQVYSLGHGLTNTPKVIITKERDGTLDWITYHESLGFGSFVSLNATNASNSGASGVWGTTPPNDSVFEMKTSVTINPSKQAIAYCFAEVAGFSKFGSYDGTGSGVQNTINCGFNPRFVMIKRTNNTGGWRMFDNVRGLDKSIQAQSANAEYDDTTNYLDFYADGFEFNNGVTYQFNPDVNASDGEYIYMAFANQF